MCGIFGIIIKPGSTIQVKAIKISLRNLALFSESRGKDSSGMAFKNEMEQTLEVIKGDIPISKLLKLPVYKKYLGESLNGFANRNGFAAMGHARLVTNGSQLQEVNNQPVIKDGILTIHNGIIVNADELWSKNPDLNRNYSIDTEILPAMVRQELNKGNEIFSASNRAFADVEGTYSTAMLFDDRDELVLATNNGSLYFITDQRTFFVFASERYFLIKLQQNKLFRQICGQSAIEHLMPGQCLMLNTTTFELRKNENGHTDSVKNSLLHKKFIIHKHIIENKDSLCEVVIDPVLYLDKSTGTHFFEKFEYNKDAISSLRRCTKCLLPETFPFINYDHDGVCNYCRNYKIQNHTRSFDELKKLVEPYRSKKGEPDCIVPFSGGRDSTYSLHIIKKELGLNPIAFTYDWGMVTDLARRNIARVCGKLGVENIIVSADIRWKRENIRKNVTAWLKNPELGMVPLFMAGDKFFFYHANNIKKQTGIDLNIWGINNLENTQFKTGFAGLTPKFNKKWIYSLTLIDQFKLFGFVAGNVLKSPGYINQSVINSLGSFAARYIAPKTDYFHLFDYYKWDEEEINNVILKEYNWEKAIDTQSTWRIGDGTASFYNYIYYTVAGFSENDTFRSNQIREGMLERETALKLCEEDNRPRYETLRWYLAIIGLDFETVIDAVNNIPKLYVK